jgi:hypothetical protein
MTQGTVLTCKETFSFKVNNKGRSITFKKGDRFWVTNTEVSQHSSNILNIARENKPIGYDFTPEQVQQYFMETC